MRPRQPNLRLISTVALALICAPLIATASSDIKAVAASTETVALNETEEAWLQENPVLAEIAARDPDQLREVLDKLADVITNPSGVRGGLPSLDEEAVRLLGENPVLMRAWRSSPEASADLLQLIRVASSGRKPRK